MKYTTLSVALLTGVLAGCGGREPVLEPTTTPWDATMDCTQLRLAHDDTLNRVIMKQSRQNSSDSQDFQLGIASALVFWPALFFIDTKNAEGAEAQNLMVCASNLRTLAESKDCSMTGWWQPHKVQ